MVALGLLITGCVLDVVRGAPLQCGCVLGLQFFFQYYSHLLLLCALLLEHLTVVMMRQRE